MNMERISFSHEFFENPKKCGCFSLVQVGESLCISNNIVATHKQRFFEVTFAYSGLGNCFYEENQWHTISQNDCFISFPKDIHRIESSGENPLRFFHIAFESEPFSIGEKIMNKIESVSTAKNRKINYAGAKYIFLNILQEIYNEDEYSNQVIGNLIEQLLIEIYRLLIGKTKKTYPIKYSNKVLLTRDILNYIDENAVNMKNLSELEKVFYYKSQYISKVFLSQTGKTLNKYFLSKRMDEAKKLLEEGNSITTVSEMLEYSSVHAFSRAYKKNFGVCPSYNQQP